MNIIYIVIFLIVIMLGILIYLISNKSNTSKTDIALQKAGIVGSQENFAFDGVYNTSEEILSNFEDFCNTYFPKINLGKINDLLKKYGITLTIQQIMEKNKTTSIFNTIPLLLNGEFILIKVDNNKQELGNLALIGLILMSNIQKFPTVGDDKLKGLNPYFSYNSDYKKINELRLYFNTDNNKGKQQKMVNPYTLNSDDCINNNVCYTNLDKILELDINSSEVINKNYEDIENHTYMRFIRDISVTNKYVNISDTIGEKIISDERELYNKLVNNNYNFGGKKM